MGSNPVTAIFNSKLQDFHCVVNHFFHLLMKQVKHKSSGLWICVIGWWRWTGGDVFKQQEYSCSSRALKNEMLLCWGWEPIRDSLKPQTSRQSVFTLRNLPYDTKTREKSHWRVPVFHYWGPGTDSVKALLLFFWLFRQTDIAFIC